MRAPVLLLTLGGLREPRARRPNACDRGVECREPVPERPAMPTELLLPGASPWVLMLATLAEMDRRKGYEVQLRATFMVCLSPLEVQTN